MQKIFRLLLVAAAILIAVVWFSHWSHSRAHNGQAQATGQPATAPSKSLAPDTTQPAATPDQTTPTQQQAAAQPTSTGTPMVPQHAGLITQQPAANALSPHPPSGFVTASNEKFALYRQGDLTYRLNTRSGQACVLLATDALWQKPVVYQHGCATAN